MVHTEDFGVEDGDTMWFEDLFSMVGTSFLPTIDSTGIRRRLAGPKLELEKEIGKDVSPVLNLMMGETGDKQFLKHTTLTT